MAVVNLDAVQDLLKKADQLRLAGSFDQARDILEPLIQQNPFFAPAKLSLGRVFFESGNLENAQAVLEEFFEFVPDHSLANKILARIYLHFSQISKAKAKIELVLRVTPEDATAKKILQEIESIDGFKKRDSEDEDTKKNSVPANTATIAEIYRSQGHLHEALQIYQELFNQDSNPLFKHKIQELEKQISTQPKSEKPKGSKKEKLERVLETIRQNRRT